MGAKGESGLGDVLGELGISHSIAGSRSVLCFRLIPVQAMEAIWRGAHSLIQKPRGPV